MFFLLCFLLIELNEYLAKELKDDDLMKHVKAGRAQCLDVYKRAGVEGTGGAFTAST